MKEQVLHHAVCQKYGQHFLIEAEKDAQGIRVINFEKLTDEQAEAVSTPGWEAGLVTDRTLRSCAWCGSRTVAGCKCSMDHGMCPEQKGNYRFQCLYCKELVPASGAKSLKELKISVSSPGFDNIGEILSSMNLTYRPFTATGFDCDVLFLNCGTSDPVNARQLQEFVRNGGCVYMSDWAEQYLKEAFPGKARISRTGSTGTVKARILDKELREIIGDYISVVFDLGSWGVIAHHSGETLIETADILGSRPLMFSFREGKGQVFYTSFHNHAQADEKEKTVLRVMLARQFGSVTNMSTEVVLDAMGLNISAIRQTMNNQ